MQPQPIKQPPQPENSPGQGPLGSPLNRTQQLTGSPAASGSGSGGRRTSSPPSIPFLAPLAQET
jgi:hypothetical protein